MMSDRLTEIQSVQIRVCTPDGEKLKSEREALDLIGEAIQQGAELILGPVQRLEDDFFRLKTRLAGHIIQKFVTYRRRLVILGDSSGHVAQSRALKACGYETNRGTQGWFLTDLQELNQRLGRMQQKGLPHHPG